MAKVKNRNPPFLKVIFSLSVDIMKAKTQMYYEEKRTMKKTQEKKHNKRKIKISKVKKFKPNLLFFPATDVVHSPFIPFSPLLRRLHELSLALSRLSSIPFCARSFASVEFRVCRRLFGATARSVLVNPKNKKKTITPRNESQFCRN